MRIGKIFKLLRSTMQRRVDAVYKTTGYNIIINSAYFYRHEARWKAANKITRRLQRKGIRAEMRRVVVATEVPA